MRPAKRHVAQSPSGGGSAVISKRRTRSSVFPVVQYEFFALLNDAISALSGYYLWPRLCSSTLIIFAYANERAAYWVNSRDSTDLLTEIQIGERPSGFTGIIKYGTWE